MTVHVFVHGCQGNKFDASSQHIHYYYHFWVLLVIDMKKGIEISKNIFIGILPLKMTFGPKNDILLLKYVFSK